jgi:hypothetical protein
MIAPKINAAIVSRPTRAANTINPPGARHHHDEDKHRSDDEAEVLRHSVTLPPYREVDPRLLPRW